MTPAPRRNPFLAAEVEITAEPKAPAPSKFFLFLRSEQKSAARELTRWLILVILGLMSLGIIFGVLILGDEVVSPILKDRDDAAFRKSRAEQTVAAWYSANCRTTQVDPKQRCLFCRDPTFPADPNTADEQQISAQLGGAESIHHGVTFCKENGWKWPWSD